jgi:hypothetical protein
MRNSAAAITDTTYHIYAVSKADGTQDYYAHTSTTVATVITALQAESGGTDYLYARRIGSIVRASGTILAFTQGGSSVRREYTYTTPVLDVAVTNLTTARSTYTLASLPVGLRIKARTRWYMSHASSGTSILVVDLNETDAAPAATSPLISQNTQVAGGVVSGFADIFTNTSAQIGARSTQSNTTLNLVSCGWIDDLSL